MSEAVAIAEGGAAAASVDVVVADWLRMTLLAEAGVVERVLRGQSPRVVAIGGAGAPQARVRVVAVARPAQRWLDRAPSAVEVDWWQPPYARVEMQRAEATLCWTGEAEQTLDAELCLDPDDAPAFRDALQMLAVMLAVVHKRRLLAHGSAVLHDGGVTLFLGDSGAGKSTTAHRLADEGLTRIADDAIFVQPGTTPRVTPFFGDRAFKTLDEPAATFSLGGVFRLEKNATESRIEPALGRSISFWLGSLMVPAGPPPYARALMDLVGELAVLPVGTFRAAATGPLLPALHGLHG